MATGQSGHKDREKALNQEMMRAVMPGTASAGIISICTSAAFQYLFSTNRNDLLYAQIRELNIVGLR